MVRPKGVSPSTYDWNLRHWGAVKIEGIGVIGAGTMGAGICEVTARAGCEVVFSETSKALIDSGYGRIQKSPSRAVERNKISVEDADAARGRTQGTTELPDLSECDRVIEAAPELIDVKKQIFGRLDGVIKPGAIIALTPRHSLLLRSQRLPIGPSGSSVCTSSIRHQS